MVRVQALTAARKAASVMPDRADAGAYSWKFAGKPRIKSRVRFGTGEEFRSGPRTRLLPPVILSTTYVVFGAGHEAPAAGIMGDLVSERFFSVICLCG